NDFKYSCLDQLKDTNKCVITNGSIEMVKHITKHLPNCYPGAYCDFNNFLCSKYYSYFGDLLFNDRYALLTLKEIQRNRFQIYTRFGKEALIFIRPNSGDKLFQAQLLDLIDLDRFCETNKHLLHELMIVSTPKTIRGEYRFVVSKHKEILGHSTYKFQDQICKIPAVPKEATILVEKLLEIDYYPDSVFCYDVCDDSDGDFWLLELTSFSSCGLYATNKKSIVKRVSEIAEEDWKNKYGTM
ncbi:MAG: ATP-grasp domain-containing protein, partial [Nanoarchaeota archaeon]